MVLSDKEMQEIFHRRDQILKHQPKCAACGSDQMQIMRVSYPARWRCRRCKVWVTFEPIEKLQEATQW